MGESEEKWDRCVGRKDGVGVEVGEEGRVEMEVLAEGGGMEGGWIGGCGCVGKRDVSRYRTVGWEKEKGD